MQVAATTSAPTLESSAFSDPNSGDTHAASQWHVTTTSGDYSSPVFDSGGDSSHLTSISSPSGTLDYNTAYYWRVRHQDNHGDWSPYSAETCFTTTPMPEAPVADFSASSTSGTVPLVLQFTDKSTGAITSWEWGFNNDGTADSTEQNPSYTYGVPGKYAVSLKVTGPGGSDTEVKSGYISATN